MNEIIIGCGGWSFFNAPGDPLVNYSKVFDFVEVNSTFYRIPDIKTCKIWKQKVKSNSKFLFSVKAKQDLTHKYKLRPIEPCLKLFDEMKNICKILNTTILVLQTPIELQPTRESFKDINDFFSVISSNDLQITWETRGEDWKSGKNIEEFKSLLKKYNISHCADYSKEFPIYHNPELAYTRIFGPGIGNKYQFDDNEIKNLNTRFNQMTNQSERVVVSFHTQRMVHDAARSQEYKRTGKLIGVSGKIGIFSIMNAIQELEIKNKNPITKKELLINHGWKIYDKTTDSRERIENILKNIPNKFYYDLEEVKAAILKLMI